LDEVRFPVSCRFYTTEPDVQVLVHTQRPEREPAGQLILVHGLEGSSDAGYKKSMAQHALEAGFVVHRFNLRGCGGTEGLSASNYHAGQTSDVLYVARELVKECPAPMFLCGFSLGGNVVLKLAGELGDTAKGLIAGAIAVSTPLDLGACVERIQQPQNFLYERRFLSRLKERIRIRARQHPHLSAATGIEAVRTVYDFDDRYTAKFFGFGSADNYYGTQSSKNFLGSIRIPTLVIQAKDDPMIPFSVFAHPAFESNPNLRLLAVDHGGHLGFLARGPRRFWLDGAVLEWVNNIRARAASPALA